MKPRNGCFLASVLLTFQLSIYNYATTAITTLEKMIMEILLVFFIVERFYLTKHNSRMKRLQTQIL